MESNQENNLEITPSDELEATDLAEISGGSGGHKDGYKKGGKGGSKSITVGDIQIIDDIASDNTINIGEPANS